MPFLHAHGGGITGVPGIPLPSTSPLVHRGRAADAERPERDPEQPEKQHDSDHGRNDGRDVVGEVRRDAVQG